jgi:hypothetical protein
MSAAQPKRVDFSSNTEAEALNSAEAAMTALAGKFDANVQQDLARARGRAAEARYGGADRTSCLEEIFGIVHNIKGQGGSFGYQLLTRVAGSLCDFLRDSSHQDDKSMGVVEGHLSSLQFILDHKVKGSGGELGDKLMAKLAAMKG